MRLALAIFLMLSLVGAARAEDKAFAPGMEAMYVRTIQGELTKLGFYHGPVDGQPGPQTEQAIRAWQKATGRKADGVPTAAMVDALRYGGKPPAGQKPKPPGETAKPPAEKPKPDAEATPAADAAPGADGEVAAAQKLMLIEGYYRGSVDGRNGPQTQDAIKQWQENHGMERTGEVDAALLLSLAKSPTALPEPEPAPAAPAAAVTKPAAKPATKPAAKPLKPKP